MNILLIKKLSSLATSCENMALEIRKILGEIEEQKQKPQLSSQSQDQGHLDILITELKRKERAEVQQELQKMQQKEISYIFRKIGGPARDSKKRKDFLIEQILWRLFDFREGHNILRGQDN